MGGDPVAFGLVASLNHPGGNVTGITLISGEIVSKRIALLHDLLPGAKTLAVLINATRPLVRPKSRSRSAWRIPSDGK